MKYLPRLGLIMIFISFGSAWASPGISYVPLPTTHHSSRDGMGVFYHKEHGGMELLTGVPYEDLQCKNCHHKSGKLPNGKPLPYAYKSSCEDCHNFYENPSVKSPDVCLECHSRQRSELAYFKQLPEPKDLDWQDVHFREGMTCISCHTGDQLHDSADNQLSMLDPRGNDARCEDCHEPDRLTPDNHALHGDRVACATCHIKSVFTCNNCHFDTELAVQGKFKRATGKERDFIMLVNRRGYGPRGNDQVHPATYQSVVYQGKSFYTIAPFFSHTVMQEAHECKYCHDSQALKEYDDSGKITVSKWSKEKNKPLVSKGMIPIPPDWQRALQFDFADFTGNFNKPGQKDKWKFLKKGADLMQMFPDFVYPLTNTQLDKLRVPADKLPLTKQNVLKRRGIDLPGLKSGFTSKPQAVPPKVSPGKELPHK
ncbi:cytochrome c3 family protein [Candidatus Venteria ishoeyi]|uniref:Class III cytochrome C family protein n=1 Tax=Candidatus Venteria ishoeyi TaxID=1899563 RepID=A0A1H6F4X9_9GAMM|nr:cytochrome c3 family protein [Candidatus Venteria ishoeyi]SEH05190.1 Class III cytochrome C family protein [Candidatus Venteria ishoeyi]